MGPMLVQVLILVIVVGGLLYILNILPLDATIKAIGRVVILIMAALYAISLLAPMVNAQGRYERNPLEDFLRGLEARQGNSNVNCNIQHRLDRRGDIRWLRVDCSSDARYRGR
jgi:Ca2+/H+ antiporter